MHLPFFGDKFIDARQGAFAFVTPPLKPQVRVIVSAGWG
jgi:hypothetical protein